MAIPTTSRPRKLWKFQGGLHLPENKCQSNGRAVTLSEIPARLVIPMQQHVGQACEPLVQPGDLVLKGQKIADSTGLVSAPVHASSSGRVLEVAEHPLPHASALPAPCIIIETDGLDRWCELPEPTADYLSLSPEELIRRVREAGVVGMGGASFPSAVKLTPGSERNVGTVVINGAECEPFITCDDMLMRDRPQRVLAGAMIMLRLLGAEKCIVGVEDNKPEAIAALQAVLASGDFPSIELVPIPTLYPSGGEKLLVRILTGKEVPSGGLPADIGVVCHNVATAAAVADAVEFQRPLVERYVTVTGAGVAQPGNLLVRVGTMISELIPQAGGYTGAGAKLILGGPMMGVSLPNDQFPTTKATNCVLIPSNQESPASGPALACIRCGRCAEACPMGLLPQQMYWHIRARHNERAKDYNIYDCIECGCCSHVCPSHIPLVQYYRFAKADLRARDLDTLRAERARRRNEAREERLARLEAEKKARLAAKKVAAVKKKPADGDDAATPEDPKKAAIEAARQRAAAKRAQLKEQGVAPKNTENLQAFQQKQIDTAEKRRVEADQEALKLAEQQDP